MPPECCYFKPVYSKHNKLPVIFLYVHPIILLFTEYPYKFVKILKSQQVTEKDTITLLCELDDAGGEVKWTKNGQDLKADKRL